ncbi:MAG TPA: sulfatase-like hydrolase/transferase [Bryobacteraceae bacterium]|nr:sulfatase-like hydrolase/transferase [Bryobacteraceae bacterium]
MITRRQLVLSCLGPALRADPTQAVHRRTRNVVLVTADGIRRQEFFHGSDPRLAGGEKKIPVLTREQLMPFVWDHIASRGLIVPAAVTNAYRVSYPGYAEILTGRSQDDEIRGNQPVQNPTETVLEYVRRRLALPRTGVALFGSWDMFPYIGERTPGTVVINAGYKRYEEPGVPARMKNLGELQFLMLTPWPSVRHDYITFELALEYMRHRQPRLIHISLGEMDDWAHDKRYDRVLDTIHFFDQCLHDLWRFVESDSHYRGSTTLVVTADHGRGRTPEDWHAHGTKVAGAEEMWAAILGPDTPAAGYKPELRVTQSDIAPTILELLSLSASGYPGMTGRLIPQATAG